MVHILSLHQTNTPTDFWVFSENTQTPMVYHGLSWFIVVYRGLLWFIVVYPGLLWFILVYSGLLWFIVAYQHKIDRFIWFPSISHCEQLWSNKGISSSGPGCRGWGQRLPWRLVLRQKQLGLWVYLKIIIESIESLGFLAFWYVPHDDEPMHSEVSYSQTFLVKSPCSNLTDSMKKSARLVSRESTGRWHLCTDGCINTALENSNTTGPKSSCV